MPYKRRKNTKRYRRKKRYPRKSSRMLRTVTPYVRAPLPNKFMTKLRYAENFILDAGVLTPSVLVFGGNDLYDPEIAVGGHQPRGFDELMAMYQHFCVVSSKINVKFITSSTTTGSTTPNRIFISPQGSTTKLALVNDYIEGGAVKYDTLNNSTSGGNNAKSLTMACSTRKFLGVSKPLSNPDLRGTSTASPIELWSWHVGCQGFQSENSLPMNIQVLIEYIAVFTEPRTPSQS